MPLDYSKWDNLELSDDEDFECHPNVDKASMVRWRQADIHRKRLFRKTKIAALKRELEKINVILPLYKESKVAKSVTWSPEDLAKYAVQAMATGASDDTEKSLSSARDDLIAAFSSKGVNLPSKDERKKWDESLRKKYIDEVIDGWEPKWGEPEFDPYVVEHQIRFEFLDTGITPEDLARDIAKKMELEAKKKDGTQSQVPLLTPYQSLEARRDMVQKEIAKEVEEDGKKLTSDKMTEGFSSSRITKSSQSNPVTSTPSTATKTSEKVLETIHTPANNAASNAAEEVEDDDGDEEDEGEGEIKDPTLLAYLQKESMGDIYSFLISHPEIVTQENSDKVLAQGFSEGLNFADKYPAGEHHPLTTKEASRIGDVVRHSLILQYSSILGKDGVAMFFSRLKNPSHNASELFAKDTQETTDRIVARVNTLNAERKAKEAEEKKLLSERLETLRSPDGKGFKIPGEGSGNPAEEKKAATFAELDPQFQEAILMEDVTMINAYLASLSAKDAEAIVHKCAEADLLNLQVEE